MSDDMPKYDRRQFLQTGASAAGLAGIGQLASPAVATAGLVGLSTQTALASGNASSSPWSASQTYSQRLSGCNPTKVSGKIARNPDALEGHSLLNATLNGSVMFQKVSHDVLAGPQANPGSRRCCVMDNLRVES